MKAPPIIYLDTNCWRGETLLLEQLEQARNLNLCRVASTYIIARECATADTIGRSCAALERVLSIANCWLRGRDEMLKGVVSYINNDWFDEIKVEMIPFEAKRERRYWQKWLENLAFEHPEARKLKEDFQSEWVTLGEENRKEFIEQANKFDFRIDNLDDKKLTGWLHRCFDPEDLEWGGILLDGIFEGLGLEKSRIHELLTRLKQFPGLMLSYGHLLHSFISHIAGHKVDKSFVVDSLVFLPVSTNSIFVTRDRKMLKTASILDMAHLVQSPDQMLERFSSALRDTSSLLPRTGGGGLAKFNCMPADIQGEV